MVIKRIEFVAVFLQTVYFTTEWYILDRFIHYTALIELTFRLAETFFPLSVILSVAKNLCFDFAFRQPEKILVILSDSEHLVLHNKMFD